MAGVSSLGKWDNSACVCVFTLVNDFKHCERVSFGLTCRRNQAHLPRYTSLKGRRLVVIIARSFVLEWKLPSAGTITDRQHHIWTSWGIFHPKSQSGLSLPLDCGQQFGSTSSIAALLCNNNNNSYLLPDINILLYEPAARLLSTTWLLAFMASRLDRSCGERKWWQLICSLTSGQLYEISSNLSSHRQMMSVVRRDLLLAG